MSLSSTALLVVSSKVAPHERALLAELAEAEGVTLSVVVRQLLARGLVARIAELARAGRPAA